MDVQRRGPECKYNEQRKCTETEKNAKKKKKKK